MAYQLLSNSLPFGDTKQMTEEEIAARVEDGKYSMGGPAWGGVSDDAKDFVKSLLVLRDKQRPSAEKAILHRWLQGSRKIEEHASSEVIKLSEDKSAVAAMSNFRRCAKFVASCPLTSFFSFCKHPLVCYAIIPQLQSRHKIEKGNLCLHCISASD